MSSQQRRFNTVCFLLFYMIAFMLTLSVITVTYATVINTYGLDSVQQQRMQQVTKQLRCLVCQNESLAESQAGLAEDLRRRIAKMILAGRSNKDITVSLVQRYGDYIRFQPPFMATTWLLWLGPFLILLVGCVLFYRLGKPAEELKR